MRRILVIRSGAIGDTLLLLPFLKYLERQYPGVEIGLVGNPQRMRLVATQLRAARVRDFDEFAWLYVDDVSVPQREGRWLRSQDWIIHFSARPNDVFDRNLEGIGIARIDAIRALPPDDYARHAVFYPFDALGIPCSPEDLAAYLGQWCFMDRRRHVRSAVVLSPGAGSLEKRWPISCWEALLEEIACESSLSIIVLLGPAEDPAHFEPLWKGQESQVAVVRNAPLEDLPHLFNRVRAFIGNDSGITHLAAMTGIPTLALFGPTNPCRWGPIGVNSSVFRGSTLLHYPQWVEEVVELPSPKLEELPAARILDWLRQVRPRVPGPT